MTSNSSSRRPRLLSRPSGGFFRGSVMSAALLALAPLIQAADDDSIVRYLAGEQDSLDAAKAGAERGNASDQYTWGEHLFDHGDLPAGLRFIRKAADQNHRSAAGHMADLLLDGEIDGKVDVAEGMRYLRVAAIARNWSAQKRLMGIYYAAGDEAAMAACIRDFLRLKSADEVEVALAGWFVENPPGPGASEEGFARLRVAIEKGNTAAYEPLLKNLKAGKDQAPTEKLRWARRGAEQKVPVAQYYLAEMLSDGELPEKNLPEAFRLWEAAARNGHEDSCWALIYNYERTDPADAAKARAWAQWGADHNMPQILNELGDMHAEGRDGLTKNTRTAVNYWTKAADLGNRSAAGSLVRVYESGDGNVVANPEKAAHWKSVKEDLDALQTAIF